MYLGNARDAPGGAGMCSREKDALLNLLPPGIRSVWDVFIYKMFVNAAQIRNCSASVRANCSSLNERIMKKHPKPKHRGSKTQSADGAFGPAGRVEVEVEVL